MDKHYNFKETEKEILKKGWLKSKVKKKKNFTILLPPPNVTGSLHLGHALNSTIIDILLRFHRMKGEEAICLPGTDHAGIATQNAVEKMLKKEGTNRWNLGREKFVEKVWQWKKKYGDIILNQLKKIGLSADWKRERFTMSEKYSREVKKAFIHYYEKGLIYRKEKTINWCPRCQTSLSDLELEYKEEKGNLWYIKYKVESQKSEVGNSYIIVATTRPETMLGDTAIAVNPNDKRYKYLIGEKVIIPLINRKIPIIADRRVDLNFGTGALKITPAHDLLDYEIGEKNNLPIISVIDKNGRINCSEYKKYNGLKTEEARKLIVEDLEKSGALEKVEDYVHNVALCYRCHSKIEPLPSKQWFLKMDNLAKVAQSAVRSKKVKFIPKRFEKTYFNWLKNIKDWCLSRQIWWGHRLPVWFCQDKDGKEEKFIVSSKKPSKCPFCGKCEMKQSEDVLDTWFSSALWPFAGLSKTDLKKLYPSNVLITARDIINLWVSRMIFSGLEFQNKEPFSSVFIHPTILTKTGQRMSKSLGTGIDPLDLIDRYGADSLRFGIIWQLGKSQDIRWDETSLIAGRKFCNKIWNAARFVEQQTSKLKTKNQPRTIKDSGLPSIPNGTGQIPKIQSKNQSLTMADKKILKQLNSAKKLIERDIENFKFGKALQRIYHFFWHQFCDVYIEKAKKQMLNPEKNKITGEILIYTLSESLKMISLFMPFISEKIYKILRPKKSIYD